MQQAEEAAAEAETERGGSFHLEREAGIVEAQFAHRSAQRLEIVGVDREQPQNTTGTAGLKPGSMSRDRLAILGDGVADAGIGHFLDRGGDEADLAGAELSTCCIFGVKKPTRSTS